MAANTNVWYIQRLPRILEVCGNDTSDCGNFYKLISHWRIGGPVERTLTYFPTQDLRNNIYENAYDIIGWYPKKGKNTAERVTSVTADENDVGAGGGSMSKGEANMVQRTY